MRRVLVLTAVVVTVLSGCGNTTGGFPLVGLDPDLTQIDYRFTGPSVEPKYHRSYSLIASAGEANIVVDSYGDVLYDETAPIDDETWRALVRAAASLDIPSSGDSDDCVGGGFRELLVTEGGDPILDVAVNVCGDESQAQVDVVDGFMAPLLALFDMETLLAPSD